MASTIAAVRAFLRLGRLRVRRRMPPSRVTSTSLSAEPSSGSVMQQHLQLAEQSESELRVDTAELAADRHFGAALIQDQRHTTQDASTEAESVAPATP